ncbi:MAG: FHA domain-containing protein [Planctomycetes bacterium]|nr:FHA domain-containing protein [Planctomycetota bacterium]
MPAIELSFGDQDLGKYKIVKQITVIGRDPTADIVIDNLGISRHHCQVEKRGPLYVAKDLESQNGTLVGGVRISEQNLNDGDEITIGKYKLTFRYNESAGVAAEGQQVEKSVAEAPDALQTYVMDGKAIRAQLKEMEGAGGGPMSAAQHAAALDPLKPRGINVATTTYRKEEGGGFKALLVMSLLLNFLLLLGLIFFGVVLVKHYMRTQPPAVESPESPGDAEPATGEGSETEEDLDTEHIMGEGILIP